MTKRKKEIETTEGNRNYSPVLARIALLLLYIFVYVYIFAT